MNTDSLVERLKEIRIVPVINPKSRQQCSDIIQALVEAGGGAIEIVLRSPLALEALQDCRDKHPDIILGAGSVLEPETYDHAVAIGADFTISPGSCPVLQGHARNRAVPHIPGVVTASEIIAAQRQGHRVLKYYPAQSAGGSSALADLHSIFPNVSFMPSGGINISLLPGYAKIGGVLSVGGSWMYSAGGKFLPTNEISDMMRQSLRLMREP
jgi:2-dehydro-3-deoxyphosphogluconate aldolase/(4S)-4-hydroxy-2-oxoglutarate aldolase